MMKKTQWIELRYNIRHTLVSFLAVVLFVALATGLYTGIKWTGNALGSSVEAEYTDGHLNHFELSYPYGFDRSFIRSLLDNGIVSEAETYYETYRSLRVNGSRYQAKIVSLTDEIDRPYCVDGEMPKRRGEAAVTQFWAEKNGIRLGDEITLDESSATAGFFVKAVSKKSIRKLASASEKKDELVTRTFRVTAIVRPAAYLGRYADTNGMSPISAAPVGAVIYVTEQSFDKAAFCGYPKLVVRMEELSKLVTTSEKYLKLSAELEKKLRPVVEEYATQKNAKMMAAVKRMEVKLGKLPDRYKDKYEKMSEKIPQIMKEFKNYEAYTVPRQMNGSFAGIRTVMDTFRKMQYSLVSLFVIIGILVCYSTISRLVYDQTVLIGTKKAMGFTRNDIIKPFLIYSVIAVLLGATIGVLAGRFLLEPVFVASVRATYRFRRPVYYFGAVDALVFTLLQLVLILVAALVACVSISGRPVLGLLTGEQAASDREHRWLEKLPMWKHLSLMRKTIVRNTLNDHRRVISTLIGVMGCTALVVCALSMYDNLMGSFKRHMDRVSKYDSVVYYSGSSRVRDNLEDILDDNGIKHANAYYTQGVIQAPGGDHLVGRLYATDDDEFYNLLHMNDVNDGKAKKAVQGAWINVAYRDYFNAKPGDTISFTDALGQSHELVLEGFYEYYLMNYQVILPKDVFEKEFGMPYAPNSMLLSTTGGDLEKASKQALLLEAGLIINDYYGGNLRLFESIAGIARAVVAIYLLLSFILAVLLLLNLFTMFVMEKKRELITLMINGFPRKKAEQYIYMDTKFLTVIGVIAGILLGVVMGGVSLSSFNNKATYFLNRTDWMACLIGALFTSVLTLILCRVAVRKVRHFHLSDISAM